MERKSLRAYDRHSFDPIYASLTMPNPEKAVSSHWQKAILKFIAAHDFLVVRRTGRDVSLRTEVSSQVRGARSRFALCASVLARDEFFFMGGVTTIGFQ